MSHHENLILMFEAYQTENEKFVSKNNKAAGTRARKALAEIVKAAKERRKEIQEVKTDKEKYTE
jgi:vacuolar-type H+-ATPase catalytic subunit A/Vma1